MSAPANSLVVQIGKYVRSRWMASIKQKGVYGLKTLHHDWNPCTTKLVGRYDVKYIIVKKDSFSLTTVLTIESASHGSTTSQRLTIVIVETSPPPCSYHDFTHELRNGEFSLSLPLPILIVDSSSSG